MSLNEVELCKRKKEEIRLSPMTNAPTPTDMSKGQNDNTYNATKSLITQRFQTDLGGLVGVTTATQLVWLNRFKSAQPWKHVNQESNETLLYNVAVLK